MKKLSIYLDTSVLNFYLAEDDPAKKDITVRFFQEMEAGTFEVYISTLVVREIDAAPEIKREQLKNLVRRIEPKVLELDAETEKLAQRYVDVFIIPEKYRNDAVHIAAAVVNDLDAVISWNLEHMVKMRTRIEVNGINRLEGYHEIEISTPEEAI